MPEPSDDAQPLSLADHLDRFAVYKMRLLPLESVKQNPKYHPEGDALYHSLQVFHLARDVHPYDEEFLLAALCMTLARPSIRTIMSRPEWRHSGRGDRTDDVADRAPHGPARDPEKSLPARLRRELESSDYFDDLKLLRELDDAGREPGQQVDSIDEVLAYLKGLEEESYLDD